MDDILNYEEKVLNFSNLNTNICADENEFLIENSNCKMAYNLKNSNGYLTEGCGIKALKLPKTQATSNVYSKTLTYPDGVYFTKVWRYRYYSEYNSRYDYMLIAFGSDNKLYYNNIYTIHSTFNVLGNFTFSASPQAIHFRVNGQDVIGFCSEQDQMVVWFCDEQPYVASSVPKFKSICLHNNRLFAIENDKSYKVRYSSQTNPLDWTTSTASSGAGNIILNDFKGKLNKLISFSNSIFVFRDDGISKISDYGSSFSVSNIYQTSSKIYPSTICVCEDNIFFLQEDGLYIFDGYSAKKVDLKISNLFKKHNQENAFACFYNENLYISCFLNLDGLQNPDASQNNCLIEYNIKTNTFNIIKGINVSYMYALKDLQTSILVLCLNDQTSRGNLWCLCDGKDSEVNLSKLWQSGKICFNKLNQTKELSLVNLVAKQDFSLRVKTNNCTRLYSIHAKDEAQTVNLNIAGKYFEISLISNSTNFCVGPLQFVFKSIKI